MKFIRTASKTQQAYLLDNLNTAVVLVDESLAVRYVNASAEDLFESSSRQLLDINLLELLDKPDKHEEQMVAALESNSPYAEDEIVLKCGNMGHTIVATGTVTPLAEPGGAAALVIELSPRERQDIIARGELVMMQQHISRSLVRGLAHEIKNPLGGIRGAAQLLSRELPDPDQQEYTKIIIGEVDRLQTLVNRMLGPLQPPQPVPTNIHEVLERVRSVVDVEGRDVSLIRDYDPSIPDLMLDADEVMQALLNIVRNAAQALEKQGMTGDSGRAEPGSITFRTRVARQHTIAMKRHRVVAQIDIIDNGPGIPDELQSNIFYPMVSGRAEGSGLGLSIAQSMIGRQHGVIECESEPGRTAFSIFIPLDLESEGDTPDSNFGDGDESSIGEGYAAKSANLTARLNQLSAEQQQAASAVFGVDRHLQSYGVAS